MQRSMIADLRNSYGIACCQIAPVTGGWLNEKWRVSTGAGQVLVKQFSNERFSRERLKHIEQALQRQRSLEGSGVPCPAIWPCAGRAIRLLDSETAYVVMDFCPGWVESPDTVTQVQMRSLGSACGLMHSAFSRLPAHPVKGYPLEGERVLEALWANHRARVREDAEGVPAGYREAVLAQEPILNQLTRGFFERLPKGIAHEDFAADNILFEAEHVSAIVDFDRNQYSYLWHDVGRALMSFALRNGRLDTPMVAAFREGYAQHMALGWADIADALRLTWCIEVPWWIQPQYFEEQREKVARFREEVLWLTEHWPELDALLGL